MLKKPALVVLAAGMGSRYGGLKQMDPMGPSGETVLDYSVFDAIRANFTKVIFVIREDFAEDFKKNIGDKFSHQIEISYAFQKLNDLPEGFEIPEGREKPWGTAHAIRAARHEIDRPFAVINADDFYGKHAYQQASDFLTQEQDTTNQEHCAIVGYQLENTLSDHGSVNRGICQSDNNFLRGVEEIEEISKQEDFSIQGHTSDGSICKLAKDAIVSMNLWCFPESFLEALETHFCTFMREQGQELKSECYIPTVVDDLINSEKIVCHVLETSSSWFGVTYPGDKPHVMTSILDRVKAGEYPTSLT